MANFPGRYLILNDTSGDWSASDPVLMAGELGVADSGSSAPVLKVGDGVRPWSALPQVSGAGGGTSPDYVVGTTNTLAPGSFATVTINNGVSPPTISFGIPRGDVGPANALGIGTVTTGAAGTPAGATITGTPPSQTLNLVIPRGVQGVPGDPGADGATGPTGPSGPANSLAIGTVTTGAPGSSAGATITGTPPSQTLSLTIPQGPVGPAGPPGPAGSTANLDDPSAVIGLTAINGISPDAMRSDAAPPLSQAIVPTWTGAHTFNGALDVAGIFKLGGVEGTAGQVLVAQGAGLAPHWGTGLALANPSALVGLAAINGSAATAMRSDAAPALNQGIAPTWTAAHTFNGAVDLAGAIKVAGAEGLAGQVLSSQGAGLAGQWRTPLTLANPSALVGLAAINGSATTAMRSDAAPALNQGIAPTWTAAHTFNGALDVAGIFKLGGAEGTAGQVLVAQGAGLAPQWGAGVTLANPSALVGLAAVNGSAATAMRSDAAPSLSQAIAPTWTGAHRFNAKADFWGEFRAEGVEGIAGQVWSAQGAGLPPAWRSASGGAIDLGYTFNTGLTAVDPGAQKLSFNAASYAATTIIRFDSLAANNFDASTILSLLTPGNRIYIQGRTDSTKAAVFEVTATATDMTGWWSVPVTLINSRGTLFANNTDLTAIFILSSASGATVANPTASIGMTAVNGVLATAMRSDAAPAINPAIIPTWTGQHTFTALITQLSNSGGPVLKLTDSDAGTDATNWRIRNNAGQFILSTENDAGTEQVRAFTFSRTAANITTMDFGNATSNPAYNLLGTGITTVFGSVVVGGATGGSKGSGTVNAVGLYVNGVAVAALTAANPTALVGATAVNGSAATFMRSDAAPALDLAANLTWTGTHTYNANPTLAGGALIMTGSAVQIRWSETDQTTDEKAWQLLINGKVFTLQTNTDGFTLPRAILTVARGTGTAVASMSFGNATDNPTYSFLGVGTITAGGPVVFNDQVTTWSATSIQLRFSETDQAADEKNWQFLINTKLFKLRTLTDAFGGPVDVLSVTRGTGVAITAIDFGNATNNPTYNLLGTGVVTSGGVHLGPNGAVGAPTYSFTNDGNTGIYSGGADVLAFSTAGTLAATLESGGLLSLGDGKANGDRIRIRNSTAVGVANLHHYFNLASGTQLSLYAYDGTVTTGGTFRISHAQVYFADGAVGTPVVSFTSDTNTGLYRIGADNLGFAAGGAEVARMTSAGVTSLAFTTTSSRAIKRETGAPTYAADILARLRPVLYRLLANDEREYLGLIAEEVAEVCPQLSDGKTVAYDRLALLLLADWQETRAAA